MDAADNLCDMHWGATTGGTDKGLWKTECHSKLTVITDAEWNNVCLCTNGGMMYEPQL